MTPIRFPRRLALRLADPNKWLLRGRRARARRRADDGFVLLESIVSISLVMIMTAALAALFISTSQATNHLRIRQVAVQLADSGIERVRAYEPAMLQNDRDPDLVEDQYRDGMAGPSGGDKLSNMLATIADPYPASGTGTTAARPAVPASCPAASEPTDIPASPVCQAIGNRPFLVNYYLGNCYVPTSGTDCVATKPTADTFLTYLRAVIAVTWANDHCSNSSCLYVTSTLINNNPDPRFTVDYPVVESPDIVAPDRTSNVGDSGPFDPTVALRSGTGVAPFTWSATNLPPGLKMATDGTITGTIKAQAFGTMTYTVTVNVLDGLLQRKAATFTWTVRQPTITSPGNQNTVINTPVTLPVVATCWQPTCTYTMSGAPTWLSINPATGVLTGTPSVVGTTSGITVTVTDGNGIKATTAPFDWVVVPTPAAVCVTEIALTNGSFEAPALNTSVPVNTFNYVTTGAPNWMRGGDFPLQWNTTEPDGIVELWHNGFNVQSANGGQPISAEDGSTWAELNANATGALYQDLATDPGVVLQWSVWHRGRYSSAANASKKDVMQVQIGSTTSQSPQIPTGQTTPAIADGPDAWVLYRGFYVVPPGQTTTRFQFAAISTASGDNSIGNFIDNLSLNNKVACVQQLPDPQTSTVGTAIAGLQLSAIRGSGNYAWGGGNTLPHGLTISTNGLISGTPTTPGTYSVAVTLTDTQTTYSTTVPFTWTVVPKPTITAPGTQTTSSGGAVSLALSTSCLNRPCTYTMNTGPAGLTVSSSGVISGTITSAAQNFNNVTVTVQDKAGVQATTNPFTWKVIGGPGILNPGDQKTLRGAAVSLAITASGGTGTLSYSASGLPSWLTINSTTGLITGVAPASADSTTTGISITVSDDQSASATTAPFSWTVYSSPTVNAPLNQVGTTGSTVNLSIASTCPNSPCTFAISGQPTGLTINNSGVISGTIGGTATFYPNVRVTITDAGGASARSSAFTWTISYGQLQPTTPPAQLSTVNAAITPLQLTASGGSGSYSWTGTLPAGLTMTSAGRISGIPTSVGSGTITLTVNDTIAVLPPANISFNWVVVAKPTVNALANQTITVGAAINLVVTSTCPNLPCSYTLNNGPAGLSIDSNGLLSGTVGGTAQTYNAVTITVTDAAGATGTSPSFTWTVKAKPTVTAPVNQTTTIGAVVNLPVTSTCPNTPCTFTMSGAPTGLSINSSTGTISGTVTSSAQTFSNVVITITDVAGISTNSGAFSWTVKAKPSVTAPANQAGTIGSAVNLSVASTCPNAPCTFTMSGAPTGLTIDNSGVISGTIGGSPATYPNVRVTITDAALVSVQSSAFTWTISYPPLMATTPLTQTSTVNTAITPLQLTASGGSGSYSWSATALPAGLSVNAAGLISGTPTTVSAGTTATLKVTDTVTSLFQSISFTWVVKAKPTVTSPGNRTTTVGAAISLPLTSTCPNSPCSYALNNGPAGLSISPAGLITGTVGGSATTYNAASISVTDAAGATVTSTTFTWTVKAQPTVTNPGDQVTTLGVVISLPAVSTCANTPCTFTASGLPSGLSISSSTGTITGTVGGTAQTYSVIVTITDAAGVSTNSGAFSWTVNAKPTVTSPGTQTTTLGATVSLQLTSSCSNSPCNYTLINGPATLSVSSSGLITGTVTSAAQTFSNVSVRVTDAAGVIANSATFTWTVKLKPTVTALANQTTTDGAAVSRQLTSSCPNTPCSYTLNNGPAGLSISNTGLISGTVTSSAQTFSNVTVTITDAAGVSANSAVFTWTVKAKPTVTAPADQTDTVGATVSLQLVSSCSNTPCSYALINGPAGLSISSSGLVSGTITSAAQTFSNASVRITDAASVVATSAAFTWDLNAAPTIGNPGNQTVRGGTADSLDMSTKVAGGAAPYVYSATGLPAWLTINSSTGVISGTAPTARSLTSGITVKVTDSDGVAATSTSFQWFVSDPSIAIPNQVTKVSTAVSMDLDTYTTGGTAPYTYVITNKPSWLTYTAATHVLSGTAPSTAGTTLSITVQATDSDGTVVTSTAFTWKVVASSGITWNVVAAKSSVPGTAISSVNMATPVTGETANTFTAVGLPPGLTIATTGVISGTPTLPGTYRATVSANDSAGNAVPSAPFVWTVTDLAWSTIGTQSTVKNTADSLDLTAFDSGGVGPLTYSASGLPTGMTINATNGLISGSSPTKVNYTVTVTATDLTDASVSTTFTWKVTN